MTISLASALKAVKEDEKWVKKLLIGSFIYVIMMIASGMIGMETSNTVKAVGGALYLIFYFVIYGFMASTGNKMINSDSNQMAEWNEKNILITGLKFFFSYLVYCIVFILLFTILSTLLLIAITLVLGLIYMLISALLHVDIYNNLLLPIIFGVITLTIYLYFVQYLNTAITCYYKNLKFRDIMAFKKHFRIIKENQHAAWTLLGKEILFTLLIILVCFLLTITIIGILALPFIFMAISIALVSLFAQYGKHIEIGKYLEE